MLFNHENEYHPPLECQDKKLAQLIVHFCNKPFPPSVFRCWLELELYNDKFGFNVLVEEMTLGDPSSSQCEDDYLQFARDFLLFTSRKSRRKCGKYDGIAYAENVRAWVDVLLLLHRGNIEKKFIKFLVSTWFPEFRKAKDFS